MMRSSVRVWFELWQRMMPAGPSIRPASSRMRRLLGIGLVHRFAEVKGFEQVVQRRGVGWNIGVVLLGRRVRQVVAAAVGQRIEVPIPLNELQQRDVVR